jgi:hypothetical protein
MVTEVVKVLNKYGSYSVVPLSDVYALLGDQTKAPEVHHLNAVAEVADPTLFPLITRGLESPDKRMQRAIAGIAMRLRLRELAPELSRLASNAADPLTKALLSAGAIYLREPDRGLSLVLENDPLCFALVANLLLVRDFDLEDFNLAGGAFLRFVKPANGKIGSVEQLLNAINGLARALMADEVLNKVQADKVSELWKGVQKMKRSPTYRKLDKDGREELALIEEALEKKK